MREVRHVTFSRDAELIGAMAAKAGVEPRASLTVRDGGTTWLLAWPDRDTALAMLTRMWDAVEDLAPDLDPPVVVDLDRLRARLRARVAARGGATDE